MIKEYIDTQLQKITEHTFNKIQKVVLLSTNNTYENTYNSIYIVASNEK